MNTNFLDTLFDRASSTFSKLLDVDLKKFELKLISQAQAQTRAAEAAAAPVGSQSFDPSSLLPLVVLVVGGFVVYKIVK